MPARRRALVIMLLTQYKMGKFSICPRVRQAASVNPESPQTPMISVAAIRMQQFGVQFYQASLSASDIDKLVRFEVLNYGDAAQPPVRGGKARAGAAPSKVN